MNRDSLYSPNGGSSVKTVIYTRINWKIKKVLKQLNIIQKEIFAIDKEFACIYIIYITYMIFEWDENKEDAMKKNYNFSNAVKNPYAKKLKKTICINISESVLAYFKELAEKTNIPYQTLINMFLEQAKADKMEPKFVSKPTRKKQVA